MKTIFLAGTGRSGTTWLQELINFNQDFRVLFEPFHRDKIPVLHPWQPRQYFRPDHASPEDLNIARQILRGEITHPWIDQMSSDLSASNYLLKDIRAHLLLPWLKQQFPELSIVLLLRHPCAVAHSKQKLGWDSQLEWFLRQPELMTDFLYPFQELLLSAQSAFEKHILLWCVENYIPLKQFKPGEIFVCFYEALNLEPEKEFFQLMKFLGLESPLDLKNQLKKPSAMTRPHSPIYQGASAVSHWQNQLSTAELELALKHLQRFGLDLIYTGDPYPLVSGKEALQCLSPNRLPKSEARDRQQPSPKAKISLPKRPEAPFEALKFPQPSSPYLVYTSAGDQSNLQEWLQGRKNFDLWITYYGDQPNRYLELADGYNLRKGGKFPNFYAFYQAHSDFLRQYEAIWVSDDDLLIQGEQISMLFEIRKIYDLWLLQPAFDPQGKVSHTITQVNPKTWIRFTNFVEVTCPLFKTEKLLAFMEVYDPILVGYGIDYWYQSFLVNPNQDKIAIVDALPCLNPLDKSKNHREIDQLQSFQQRLAFWVAIKAKYQLNPEPKKQFGYIEKKPHQDWLAYIRKKALE